MNDYTFLCSELLLKNDEGENCRGVGGNGSKEYSVTKKIPAEKRGVNSEEVSVFSFFAWELVCQFP
jgi:hypothetical protein